MNDPFKDPPWPAKDAQLTELWAEGLPTSEIGRRLGVTRNSVIGRARRLKLTPRPSPIKAPAEITLTSEQIAARYKRVEATKKRAKAPQATAIKSSLDYLGWAGGGIGAPPVERMQYSMNQPERLAHAVIAQAWSDAFGTGAGERRQPDDVTEAWRFLTDPDGDWAMVRKDWCEAGDRCPDTLRARALHNKQRYLEVSAKVTDAYNRHLHYQAQYNALDRQSEERDAA